MEKGPALQPNLQNELVSLIPLQWDHFEPLYQVACDPLVWVQHPNPNRYERPVFENYFRGAMDSGGALLVLDAESGKVIGSSRFYDHKPEQRELKIGYTFFARSSWGKGHNASCKHLMIGHAFGFVDKIVFHVGEHNLRSRIAMTRLGAELAGMEEVAYYGEPIRMNCVFVMRKPEGQ
jgi:N-acetyltransferase